MRRPKTRPGESRSATTGRQLVLLREGVEGYGLPFFENSIGVRAACSFDFPGCGPREDELSGAMGLVLDKLGVAVIDADPDQLAALERLVAEGGPDGPVLAVEPERIVSVVPMRAPAREEKTATWGLKATGVPASACSGKGVRVAVLDTGFDLKHPDFPNRAVVSKSFVPGELAQDGHGHGTHCIGTSCGPKDPWRGPRYGIAWEAEIHAGKVLDNTGGGADGWILTGVNWAITARCDVLSMSLGAAVEPGTPWSRVFETVAIRALKQGSLIVAAAGNESERRAGVFAPVGHPANCPSVLAVGAVDENLEPGFFSNRASGAGGGEIDVAAPGVDVYSSFLMPDRYRRLSGTSMATPHVAGLAALWAEALPGSRGRALWDALLAASKPLPLLPADVGAGLPQAPPPPRGQV